MQAIVGAHCIWHGRKNSHTGVERHGAAEYVQEGSLMITACAGHGNQGKPGVFASGEVGRVCRPASDGAGAEERLPDGVSGMLCC